MVGKEAGKFVAMETVLGGEKNSHLLQIHGDPDWFQAFKERVGLHT